jgi:uroporphyrinogen-III decarboxylase
MRESFREFPRQRQTAILRRLINAAARDGGFIMNSGAVLDQAKPENVSFMVDFTKEYAIYR